MLGAALALRRAGGLIFVTSGDDAAAGRRVPDHMGRMMALTQAVASAALGADADPQFNYSDWWVSIMLNKQTRHDAVSDDGRAALQQAVGTAIAGDTDGALAWMKRMFVVTLPALPALGGVGGSGSSAEPTAFQRGVGAVAARVAERLGLEGALPAAALLDASEAVLASLRTMGDERPDVLQESGVIEAVFDNARVMRAQALLPDLLPLVSEAAAPQCWPHGMVEDDDEIRRRVQAAAAPLLSRYAEAVRALHPGPPEGDEGRALLDAAIAQMAEAAVQANRAWREADPNAPIQEQHKEPYIHAEFFRYVRHSRGHHRNHKVRDRFMSRITTWLWVGGRGRVNVRCPYIAQGLAVYTCRDRVRGRLDPKRA